MHRTQVLLDEEQLTFLQRRASQRGTSMAAEIRAAVELLRQDDERATDDPLALIGAFVADVADGADEHDRYLDAARDRKLRRR